MSKYMIYIVPEEDFKADKVQGFKINDTHLSEKDYVEMIGKIIVNLIKEGSK